MSPLPWTVQLPPVTSWLPGGTPGPPMSAHDQPDGHTPGGGVVTAARARWSKTTGTVVPLVPLDAARPARYVEPKGRTWVEPSTGVQVTPSVEVKVDRVVWAGLNRLSWKATTRR